MSAGEQRPRGRDGDTSIVFEVLGRFRGATQAAYDAAMWAIALFGGVVLRYDFHLEHASGPGYVIALLPAVLAQIDAGLLSGLYTGRWRFGSFEEVGALVRAVVIAGALLFVADLWILPNRPVPLGSVIIACALALFGMGGGRWLWRGSMERRARRPPEGAKRLIVFGAGEAGHQSLTAIARDPNADFEPVALLDDDPAKVNLRILGVPVVGTAASLEETARMHRAHTLLIAAPSAPSATILDLGEQARALGLEVRVVPPTNELFGDYADLTDFRDLSVDELLDRDQVEIDTDAIMAALEGRIVLVTGAGGSIGSELARQIAAWHPASLFMLDRDESALLATQLSIEGKALLDTPSLLLGDIRDAARMREVMNEIAPDVVFHAAALKHLTLLERFPEEAWKSNVIGTLNLLETAREAGVARFVNISTDKAADPISVLGYSKRVAERLTAGIGVPDHGAYLSVRFANVLGSRGSVVEIFRTQAAAGRPLTVTDPEVTRYVMTIPEAVRLVLQASVIGRSGEVLVLDIGSPVRILDVALRFASRRHPPLDIVFTGLRPGEKRHEALLGVHEEDQRPVHRAIAHVDVPGLRPDMLHARSAERRAAGGSWASVMLDLTRCAGDGTQQPGNDPVMRAPRDTGARRANV